MSHTIKRLSPSSLMGNMFEHMIWECAEPFVRVRVHMSSVFIGCIYGYVWTTEHLSLRNIDKLFQFNAYSLMNLCLQSCTHLDIGLVASLCPLHFAHSPIIWKTDPEFTPFKHIAFNAPRPNKWPGGLYLPQYNPYGINVDWDPSCYSIDNRAPPTTPCNCYKIWI